MTEERLSTVGGLRRPALVNLRRRALANAQLVSMRVIGVALFVWACFAVSGFATTNNFKALLSSVALVGIVTVGMALITLSGNFFMLSMGATVAVATILFASLLELGLLPALLLTVACGGVIGLLQGVAVGGMGADPIIATIAAASIILGIGELASGGLTVVGQGDASLIGEGSIFGVLPVQALFFFVLVAVMHLLVERTRFGRELRLVGANRDAATVAGVRVRRSIVLAYVLAAGCAALAGALLSAESGQGQLRLGADTDFDAIAAVLVGGVAVTGGRGTVADAAFGALFIALVTNILLIEGYAFDIQLLVKGAILLAAIALSAYLTRRRT